MRVALVGNMNNNNFAITRFLRDQGVDAELLLFDNELNNFPPSADTYDEDYSSYTRQLDWGGLGSFINKDPADIARDLAPFDFVFANGSAPAFAERIGRPLDFFIPYGSDMIDLPFFSLHLARPTILKWRYLFAKYQKLGIENARRVLFLPSSPAREKLLARFKLRGEHLKHAMIILYPPAYSEEQLARHRAKSVHYEAFLRIRKQHDLIVFHHARHLWKTHPDVFSCKRNDILLRGFAAFVRARPDVKACLLTLEYGDDVEESRSLIRQLGINERVAWMPAMPRKEVMMGLSMADIGTGEFGISHPAGGTIFETLAMGKPIMHHLKKEDHHKYQVEALYPYVNINREEDITAALLDYLARPDHYRQMGIKGKQWLNQYAIQGPLALFMSILNQGPIKQSFSPKRM